MFKSGMPVYGASFIDRKQHLKDFNVFVENNQHIMIKAPRRFGKTSLVLHLFKEKQYSHIYIDIKRASSLKLLAEQIINEVYSLVKIEGIINKAKESITSLFSNASASAKIDLGILQITLEKLEQNQKGSINEVEFFMYALELVEKIATKEKLQIKFALDEFQAILDIADNSILDKMRSVIQMHQNVTYIFLGSIESIMNKIFMDKTSAFFHFAKIIELGGLDIEELQKFCEDFFNSKGIIYDYLLIDVIKYLEGHPYYSMRTLQNIYYKILSYNTTNHITKQDCIEGLTTTLLEAKPYLEESLERIKQKKHHFAVIRALARGEAVGIDRVTLYKTYKSLEDMGYVKKEARGEYSLTDILLKTFLQQDNDAQLINGQIYFSLMEQ